MARWEAHRGDEWWYRDDAIEAEVAANHALVPPAFVITVRSLRSSGVGAQTLLRLLRATLQQPPEFQISCSIDSVTAPLLTELRKDRLVEWETVAHPHSRDARIIHLAPQGTA